MPNVVNNEPYETFVREIADSLGIAPLEISRTSDLRGTLRLRFNDILGRAHDVFVPVKTPPAGLQSMLRHVHGPRPRDGRAATAR